ncbi:hypothetical protein EVAR_37233_1 [Eumeta japonica]|uniref:Uncharacterized protein n=1 Tax=Eumeta variegata TaxID=151549 RepID=A0A4C1Y5E6_EUMVA|nr:hypothetical protein EVAR_37233_1 [Eumeta japonica]
MCGAWKCLVRSVKTALAALATLRKSSPRKEVLHTLLSEAEHIVNSRPLTEVNIEPTEAEGLTLNHFLIGRPCDARWLKEYLSTLVPRRAGSDPICRALTENDIVLIVDPSSSRYSWLRGIIKKTSRVLITKSVWWTSRRQGAFYGVPLRRPSSWCHPRRRLLPVLKSSDATKSFSCAYEFHTRKSNSQDAPTSPLAKASETANSAQPSNANKAPIAAKITTDEADVTETITPKKLQRLPPLFIHDKGRWSEIWKQCDSKRIIILNARNISKSLKIKSAATPDFRNLSALLEMLKVAYYTYFLKEEREFRVVLREIPKELSIEELSCPRAPKRKANLKLTNNKKAPPPPAQTALRRTPARAFIVNLSYAKTTAEPRKDPPKNVSNDTSTEDIKVLLSVITSIDIGELAFLAKKLKAAANPVEKIVVLAEHVSLVEAI